MLDIRFFFKYLKLVAVHLVDLGGLEDGLVLARPHPHDLGVQSGRLVGFLLWTTTLSGLGRRYLDHFARGRIGAPEFIYKKVKPLKKYIIILTEKNRNKSENQKWAKKGQQKVSFSV